MKTCVVCGDVEVKGIWKTPNLTETVEVQKGYTVTEAVCPSCQEQTDS